MSEYLEKEFEKYGITQERTKGAIAQFFENERARLAEIEKDNYGVLSLGKYKGKKVEDIAGFDMKYCQWLVDKSGNYLTGSVAAELERLGIVKK